MDKLVGLLFLTVYIVAVGLGSFLQKFVMGKVTPFQLEVITGIGMLAVSIPALLLAQKSLQIPVQSAPLAWVVGLLFSIGSFVYVLAVARLPVGIVAPISTGYVILAIALSTIFLHESLTLWKSIGIAFTLVGVVILSMQ
jgi:drug/metabolite transporter (DMT)-like permease